MSQTKQSNGNGLSHEQKRLLKHKQEKADPRMYIRYNWRHPNRPQDGYDFRTNSGTKLDYLIDDDGPLNSSCWADINVFLMARGCLKTTSVLGITNWALDKYPMTEAYMSAPTERPPIKEFVDKFRNNAEGTPLFNRLDKKSLSHHKFTTDRRDEHGQEYTVHSALKTQTAHGGGEKLRGPHSHIGIFDEYQDSDEGAFSVFMEMIDQSLPNEPNAPFPSIFIIGTPKLKNTHFHDMWLRSNQRSWDGDEMEWVDHSNVGSFSPKVDDDVDPDDIDDFSVKGWHIDQPNSPLDSHNESRIEFKRQTLSKKKFANEVLAQFYSPEDDLLNKNHVMASFADGYGFRNSRRFDSDDSTVVITTDWGGGSGKDAADTVFHVTERVDDPELFIDTEAYTEAVDEGTDVDYQLHTLNIEFLDHDIDPDDEEELLREWIDKYNPNELVVDQGHNGSRRSRLRKTYGDLVTGCKFGNVNPPSDVRWKENDLDEPIIANVDKTYCCESFVDTFKDGHFVIPEDDLGDPSVKSSKYQKLISQLTAPYEEQTDTKTGKRLYIESDGNDDAFDTHVYQWFAHEHMSGLVPSVGPEVISTTNRRGY